MKLPEDKYDITFDEFYESCWNTVLLGYRTGKLEDVYIPGKIETPFGTVVYRTEPGLCVSGERYTHWYWFEYGRYCSCVEAMLMKIPETLVANLIAKWGFSKIPHLLNEGREISDGLSPQVSHTWETK